MTSKSFYSKLIRNELRRNIWAAALSLLGFLCAGPFQILVSVQNIQNTEYSPSQLENMLEILGGELESNLLNRIGIMIMATLCGIALFRFWHDRRQVDFYGALPIRREGLYLVKFVTGLLLVLPAYFLNGLISAAIVVGSGAPVDWTRVLVCIAFDLFTFLMFYACAIVCTLLSGNTIFAAVLNGWMLFSPFVVAEVWTASASHFYHTYSDWMNHVYYYTPVAGLLNVRTNLPFEDLFGKVVLPVYVVVTAALLVLSVMLFRRRKGECAGQALALRPLMLPLKIYTCLAAGPAFAWVCTSLFNTERDGGWLLLYTAIGVVVVHCVMEAIYDADVRSIFHHLPTLAAVTAAAVALTFGMERDIFRYDAWTPRESRLQWVQLNSVYEYRADDRVLQMGNGFRSNSEGLSSDELIHAAVAIGEKGTQNLDLFEVDTDSGESFPDASCYEVELSYGSANGFARSRTYRIPVDEESRQLLNTILYSEEYLSCTNGVFRYEKNMEEKPGKSPALLLTDPLRDVDRTLRDPDLISALIDALKADVLDFTPEEAATETPMVKIALGIARDTEDIAHGDSPAYYSDSVSVYPSYQRTLKLLENSAGFVSEPLRADEVLRIRIHDYRKQKLESGNSRVASARADAESGYDFSVIDPEQISALLPYLVNTNDMDRFGCVVNDNLSADVLLTSGSYIYMSFLADDIPEDLIDSLRPQTDTLMED